MKIRRWIKDAICWIGLGSFLAEYCDDCGIRQPLVWWCDDYALYEYVARETGSLCPNCFNLRAREAHIFLRWYPHDESMRAGWRDDVK